MNLENNNAKMDLRLAYSQGNMTLYPPTIKLMARYLSTQYPNKNSANQRNDKKGDRSVKKGNDPKFEDKNSNTAGSTDIHVGDTTPPEESTASSRGASIGAHILEAIEQSSRSTRFVEDIFGAHFMGDDDFWGETNQSDMSIETPNSKEIMTGNHITEHHTLKFRGSVQPELINMTPYTPQAYISPQHYQLDSPNNLKDLNILSKIDDDTDNVTNTPNTDV